MPIPIFFYSFRIEKKKVMHFVFLTNVKQSVVPIAFFQKRRSSSNCKMPIIIKGKNAAAMIFPCLVYHELVQVEWYIPDRLRKT